MREREREGERERGREGERGREREDHSIQRVSLLVVFLRPQERRSFLTLATTRMYF